MYVYMYLYEYDQITNLYMYVCMYVYMYLYEYDQITNLYMYVCMYVYMYLYEYDQITRASLPCQHRTYMNTYIHMYTRTGSGLQAANQVCVVARSCRALHEVCHSSIEHTSIRTHTHTHIYIYTHTQEAVRKQPTKSALWLALAELYMKLGKSGDAVRTLDGMLGALGSSDSAESLMIKAKAQMLTARVSCVCMYVCMYVCIHMAKAQMLTARVCTHTCLG